MSGFHDAYPLILKLEGGYKLTDDPDDRGGMTWCGISRKWHPTWRGWAVIDRFSKAGLSAEYMANNSEIRSKTQDFYREEYWDRLRLGEIASSEISHTFLSCSLLSGKRIATKLAQVACGSVADGIMGVMTIVALNGMDPELFDLRFFAARVARHHGIVRKRRKQRKFLEGWIERDLDGLKDGHPESVTDERRRV